MYDRVLRNPTECLFLNIYCGECELASLVLKLDHSYTNRLYHFTPILRIIQDYRRHTEADPKKALRL